MYGANYYGSTYFGQAYPTLAVGIPSWVSPLNHANINQIHQLVLTIPDSVNALHFEIELDTANTFDSDDLVDIQSLADQTGWEYWNDTAWVAVPVSGVPLGYSGNQVRYTLQSRLGLGVWYRRVRARGMI